MALGYCNKQASVLPFHRETLHRQRPLRNSEQAILPSKDRDSELRSVIPTLPLSTRDETVLFSRGRASWKILVGKCRRNDYRVCA